MPTFLVRPSNSEKEAFRIKLTAASLLGLKLKPGDLCIVSQESTNGEEPGSSLGPAIAWEASGGMKDNVMQTSKFLQDLYGFKLGDKLSVARSEEPIKDAEVVKIAIKESENNLDQEQISFWQYYAKLTVKAVHEYLAQGQTFSFKVAADTQQFEVIDTGAQGALIAKVTDQTSFQIVKAGSSSNVGRIVFTSDRIGGLKREMETLQELIDDLLDQNVDSVVRTVQGVLIYGAKGVGKSHFMDEIAKAGWKNIIEWRPGVKITAPKQPTLVVISKRHIPSSQSDEKRILEELDQLFKIITGTPCLVLGEARHPNDVHADLRRDSQFAEEIEIPIPRADQRKEILRALWADTAICGHWVIDQLAERTHGYVAMDLVAVLRRVIKIAKKRSRQLLTNGNDTSSEATSAPSNSYTISLTDIEEAVSQIRPSALQEIFLETPLTRWSDIGGQHHIKRQLQQAVERPLKQAKQMAAMSLPPKKGLLMYGPPGCSKTLLVRALAREAGLNFLAVKGAELISMYVGESERAVREIFRKARAASPSIIFFDEIDSIASRGRPGSELNVLTTLLNEMDGFEELRNVFVVAATNKPQSIDPALLRPGRFDNVVYIGPPDAEARKEIFQKQFEKSNYRPREASGVEVDAQYWAERTEGFSGAEVVAIRITACEMSLDEEDVTRDWYGFEHVEKALKVTAKSISRSMLEDFERWGAARMG